MKPKPNADVNPERVNPEVVWRKNRVLPREARSAWACVFLGIHGLRAIKKLMAGSQLWSK